MPVIRKVPIEQRPDPELRVGEERRPLAVGEEARMPTSWKNGIDSFSRATTIRTVVRTEIAAAANSATRIALLAPAAAADAEGSRPRRPACRVWVPASTVCPCVGQGPRGVSADRLLDIRLRVLRLLVVHRDDQRGLGDLVVVVRDVLHERCDLRALRARRWTGT